MPEFIYFKDDNVLLPIQLMRVINGSDKKARVFIGNDEDPSVISDTITIDEIVSALNNPANTDRVIVL